MFILWWEESSKISLSNQVKDSTTVAERLGRRDALTAGLRSSTTDLAAGLRGLGAATFFGFLTSAEEVKTEAVVVFQTSTFLLSLFQDI